MDNLKCVLEAQQPQPERVFVGVSGGLDSVVLLHKLWVDAVPNITVLHVNHHLQPQADAWEDFVSKLAVQYGFTFAVCHLDPKHYAGENIEAKAREGRYAFFEQHLTKASDYLVLAQHEQDQVETFFFNLQRGAGLAGLCAMPRIRPFGQGYLLRPLLNSSRQDLEQYAKIHQLTWMEDPSNQDTRLNRNFLRHEILPRLAERFPHFQKNAAQAIQHLQATRNILDSYLSEEVTRLGNPMDLIQFKSLAPQKQVLVLQTWIKTHSGKILSEKQLQVILHEVINAGLDRSPVFAIPGLRLERKKQILALA